VAALAGVSRPTVSAILNERAHCYASAATRKRVTDAAARLGYRASPMARALMGKATATVGIVAGAYDVEPTLLKFAGFEAAARESGRMTIAAWANNQNEFENTALRWLLDRFVDGVIVYPAEDGPHEELRRLVESGFPVVTLDGATRLGFATDDVSGDYRAGGELVIDHLLQTGRERIGLLDSSERCFVIDEKVAGMQRALRRAGKSFVWRHCLDRTTQAKQHWKLDAEFESIRTLLADHGREIDALVCVGDAMAHAAIRYATELGIRVPDDMAVTGYDGLALSGHTAVPLTTVDFPSEAIGRKAFELLEKRLSGERGAARCEVVGPVLLERGSSVKRAR